MVTRLRFVSIAIAESIHVRAASVASVTATAKSMYVWETRVTSLTSSNMSGGCD